MAAFYGYGMEQRLLLLSAIPSVEVKAVETVVGMVVEMVMEMEAHTVVKAADMAEMAEASGAEMEPETVVVLVLVTAAEMEVQMVVETAVGMAVEVMAAEIVVE